MRKLKVAETVSNHYEHSLLETCCDLCGKKTESPQFFKVENTWLLFFFCSLEHQRAFGVRGDDGLTTIQ